MKIRLGNRIIALCLTLALLSVTVPLNVFASYDNKDVTANYQDKTPDLVENETVCLTDNNGNVYDVLVTKYTYFPDNTAPLSYDLRTDYPVGTVQTYSFRISNDMLTLPWEIGTALSADGIVMLAEYAASIVGASLPGPLIPGLVLVSAIANAIAVKNMSYGNEGFEISVSMEYTSHYLNKEGYYLYGWSFKKLTIATY